MLFYKQAKLWTEHFKLCPGFQALISNSNIRLDKAVDWSDKKVRAINLCYNQRHDGI
jgi:hypothetical protein